jgi:hypothetical protein
MARPVSDTLKDRFEVSFNGPPMVRRTRGALAAAAMTLLADRHNNLAALRAGASTLHQFVVLVPAYDADQAVDRARAAVRLGGAYGSFSAVPTSLR